MRRDMKLCGDILSEIEKQPTMGLSPVDIKGRNADEVDFHIMLLQEAGYVDAEQVGTLWHVRRLTWAGCEYLEKERAQQRRNTAGGNRV